jgi:hypothetical protein
LSETIQDHDPSDHLTLHRGISMLTIKFIAVALGAGVLLSYFSNFAKDVALVLATFLS